MDKNGEELSFKKYRASLVAPHKRVRTLFDEVLANKAKRIKIKVVYIRRGAVKPFVSLKRKSHSFCRAP